jgi:hypothetical protein
MMAFVDLKTLTETHCFSKSQLRKFIAMGCPHYQAIRKIWFDHNEFCQWFAESFRVGPKSDSSDDIDRMMSGFLSSINKTDRS